MSLSHNIEDVSNYQYPRHSSISYRHLVETLLSHNYADYVHRLREVGYRIPVADYYHTYFGEYTPASFVTDHRGNPVFRPGYNKRWLILHHSDGVVKVFVSRYVVARRDGLRLFGDGVYGHELQNDENAFTAAVAINGDQLERFHQEDVGFL